LLGVAGGSSTWWDLPPATKIKCYRVLKLGKDGVELPMFTKKTLGDRMKAKGAAKPTVKAPKATPKGAAKAKAEKKSPFEHLDK
jgi:hypothetical protein